MLLKKYRFGFDVWALVLFFIIMIPNFIWFAVPAPNDILRGESITKTVDVIASICQVLMVMALCIFIHQDRKKISITRFIMTTVICCLLYFLCWILYYLGITNNVVISVFRYWQKEYDRCYTCLNFYGMPFDLWNG